MKNNELVVVDVNGGFSSVWTFCDADNALETVARAQADAARHAARYAELIVDYPNQADYWRRCKKQYENAKYEIMTFDEYLKRQREKMISGPVTEITEERFYEMLDVLPPMKWCTIDGVEMFCMLEMYTGTYTNQYAKIGDKYYTAMVDVTDRTTWIHERLKKSIA